MGFHNQKMGILIHLSSGVMKNMAGKSLNSTSNRHDLYGNILYDFQGFSIPTFDYLRVYGVILCYITRLQAIVMAYGTPNQPARRSAEEGNMGQNMGWDAEPKYQAVDYTTSLRRWDYVLETKPASIMGLYHWWLAMDGEWRS